MLKAFMREDYVFEKKKLSNDKNNNKKYFK